MIVDVLETNNYHNSIHELNIEDCLSKNNIPKLDKYKEYIFVILHFPAKSKTAVDKNEKKLVKGKRKGSIVVRKALHLKNHLLLHHLHCHQFMLVNYQYLQE